MPRPYLTFTEHPSDIVHLACAKCATGAGSTGKHSEGGVIPALERWMARHSATPPR
jgi:hypothetical protein